ncbi:MAG: hypothetical protein ABIS01_00130, partial [Ferruginibacter sp.]
MKKLLNTHIPNHICEVKRNYLKINTMGLFDFIRVKRRQGTEKDLPVSSSRAAFNIADTEIVKDLFKIPKEKRDGEWTQNFYKHVQTAGFALGDPKIFTGPDGFHYFTLVTAPHDETFESCCILNLVPLLLEQGLGLVINPGVNGADWVFYHGDIVN